MRSDLPLVDHGGWRTRKFLILGALAVGVVALAPSSGALISVAEATPAGAAAIEAALAAGPNESPSATRGNSRLECSLSGNLVTCTVSDPADRIRRIEVRRITSAQQTMKVQGNCQASVSFALTREQAAAGQPIQVFDCGSPTGVDWFTVSVPAAAVAATTGGSGSTTNVTVSGPRVRR